MERPRPVPRPWGLVVKKGSKILGRSSRLIPVPVSMNSSRISSPRSGLIRLRTVSVPRESIASSALSMSAMKLWIKRSWSASQRLAAGEDRRQGVVDLMHHAGRELAHRGELLRLRETLLGLAPLGDVLADGNDVRDDAAVLMHRNLGDAVMARLARRLRLH